MIKGFYKEKINGEIVICRSRENVKNMFVEFQEYLNYFTGSKFNPDDYITRPDLDEWYTTGCDDDYMLTQHHCICGHWIYNLCYIQHVPTEKIFRVGCDCYKKVDPDKYKAMKKLYTKKASETRKAKKIQKQLDDDKKRAREQQRIQRQIEADRLRNLVKPVQKQPFDNRIEKLLYVHPKPILPRKIPAYPKTIRPLSPESKRIIKQQQKPIPVISEPEPIPEPIPIKPKKKQLLSAENIKNSVNNMRTNSEAFNKALDAMEKRLLKEHEE